MEPLHTRVASLAPVPSDRLEALDAPKALRELWAFTGWGSLPHGVLTLVDPATLDAVLAEWLGGSDPTRIPIGYTGLGNLVYFRDLRQRAADLGLPSAQVEAACDFSMVDVHYKNAGMLATSASAMLAQLDDPRWVGEVLQADTIASAAERLGPLGPREFFGYVPALALGGTESPDALAKQQADAHWAMLLQL